MIGLVVVVLFVIVDLFSLLLLLSTLLLSYFGVATTYPYSNIVTIGVIILKLLVNTNENNH